MKFARRVLVTLLVVGGLGLLLPADAADDLTLSTGITFQSGFRQVDGTDLNTVLGAVNTLLRRHA